MGEIEYLMILFQVTKFDFNWINSTKLSFEFFRKPLRWWSWIRRNNFILNCDHFLKQVFSENGYYSCMTKLFVAWLLPSSGCFEHFLLRNRSSFNPNDSQKIRRTYSSKSFSPFLYEDSDYERIFSKLSILKGRRKRTRNSNLSTYQNFDFKCNEEN